MKPSLLPGSPAEVRLVSPWRWSIHDRSLIIEFPETYSTLSWAPLGSAYGQTRAIVNHQVGIDDRNALDNPEAYLSRVIRTLFADRSFPSNKQGINAQLRKVTRFETARGGLRRGKAVGMMTGVDVQDAAYATARKGNLVVGAWCTAGCSNALRIGDRATVEHTYPGTINIAVALSERLSPGAMAEAISLATEARVLAVVEASVLSSRSGLPATGTGTDCIVVASPSHGPAHRYCGKHTRLGELIGRAVLKSCVRALARKVHR